MIQTGLIKLSTLALAISLNVAPATIQVNHNNNTNPVLEIPKINLHQEFYPNDKIKNNVDKNIQVINGSVMPNKKGNVILAAHSGTSAIAYFKHLDQLKINDVVYVEYNNKKYKYIISDIYDVFKTGYVSIKRNKDKQTLTLITCKKNTNMQTVYIGYLNT